MYTTPRIPGFLSRKEYLSFDDVLLVPKYSEVNSRRNVDVSTKLCGKYLGIPILSANMESITGPNMCKAMFKLGGLGVFHRFLSYDDLGYLDLGIDNSFGLYDYAVSVGVRESDFHKLEALLGKFKKPSLVFLDVAHGAQKQVCYVYKKIKKLYGDLVKIVVGNFASGNSIIHFTKELGTLADGYKIGIGSGSACTTRLVTGVGIPQLTAVIDAVDVLRELKCEYGKEFYVISDGGIRKPADFVKALAAGADAVMIGGLLAGTNESNTPGFFKGSASHNSDDYKTSEGVQFSVTQKGPVSEVINQLLGGLRSAMAYTNSKNLAEFRKNAEFVRVTPTSATESGIHKWN